jgi:molybdopterin-biosynthesis enzyme MoeA-like protein
VVKGPGNQAPNQREISPQLFRQAAMPTGSACFVADPIVIASGFYMADTPPFFIH